MGGDEVFVELEGFFAAWISLQVLWLLARTTTMLAPEPIPQPQPEPPPDEDPLPVPTQPPGQGAMPDCMKELAERGLFTTHPNPEITPQGKLGEAIAHVKKHGYDFVRFEPWVAYEKRAEFFDRFALALLTFTTSCVHGPSTTTLARS